MYIKEELTRDVKNGGPILTIFIFNLFKFPTKWLQSHSNTFCTHQTIWAQGDRKCWVSRGYDLALFIVKVMINIGLWRKSIPTSPDDKACRIMTRKPQQMWLILISKWFYLSVNSFIKVLYWIFLSFMYVLTWYRCCMELFINI